MHIYIYISCCISIYIYTSKLAPSHHPPPASPSSASPMPHGWVRWAPASRTTWSHCATGCSDRPRSPTAADSAPSSAPARRSPGRSDIGPRPRWGHRHHWGPRHERWPHNLRSLERGVAKDENDWKWMKGHKAKKQPSWFLVCFTCFWLLLVLLFSLLGTGSPHPHTWHHSQPEIRQSGCSMRLAK